MATLACQVSIGVAAQTAANSGPRISSIRVGLANCYKVGHWIPVAVEVEGVAQLEEPRIEVTVDDSDGVPTTAAVHMQPSAAAAPKWNAVSFTKVGRLGATIQVALADTDGLIELKTLYANSVAANGPTAVQLPATAELIVSLGSDQIGLRRAFPEREASGGNAARHLVELQSVTDLPTQWFGYASVDVLVVSASHTELCGQLAADSQRFRR